MRPGGIGFAEAHERLAEQQVGPRGLWIERDGLLEFRFGFGEAVECEQDASQFEMSACIGRVAIYRGLQRTERLFRPALAEEKDPIVY